jgi:nicotinamidase/pyrazinamidase
MKHTHRHLEVVVGAQVDYVLPEGKAAIPQASQIIVPGMRRLMDLRADNCLGVLFVNNCFTEEEYAKSDYAKEQPPHCLIPGLADYEEPGVQNVFSSFMLTPRGVSVFRGYKKMRDMWARDMWDHHMKVHASRNGSASTADTLPQFVGTMEDLGLSNVTIWGVDTELDLIPAVDGFLVFGYKVRILLDLCRSYTTTTSSSSPLNSKFNAAIASGQLEIAKYADLLQAEKRKPL